MSVATPLTQWATLLPPALAGTRRNPAPAVLPGLTPNLGAEADAPEKQLLLTAANVALVQRAGQRPRPGPATLPPLPPETWPAVPDAAVRGLEALLAELPDEPNAWRYMPHQDIVLNVLADLRQLHHRLPPRTVLHVLRNPWAYRADSTIVRRVLGTHGRWLHGLLGSNSSWYSYTLNCDWEALTPQQRDNTLSNWMQRPTMLPDDSYLAKFAALPAEKRTKLLWEAWQGNGGQALPPSLQAELDALLAATPPAMRPWATQFRGLAKQSGHPRLAGHPLLAQLAEWTAPLLHLERLPGQAPRVRVKLPTAWNLAWEKAGIEKHSSYFSSRNKLKFGFQEMMHTLGPRHWAEAWQLPPAEVVALVAAAPRGQLVLEAWSHALLVEWTPYWPEPEFARALLALPQRPVSLELQALMTWHLPPAEQAAWITALLPADPAAPHEPGWVQLLQQRAMNYEQAILRPLLPVLAATLVQPRTHANAQQVAGLPKLLDHMSRWPIDARLYPEVQAALGAVAPLQPKCAQALGRFLQGLALRYDLWQACGKTAPAA